MPTHYQGSQEDVAALGAYINLMRASDSLAARLTGELESHELTMGQFGVLEALYHLGPMCQGMLGKKLLRSGGNITVVVDNLEKHGLVRRERQKDDRRKVMIRLTQPGKAILERVLPPHVEAIVKEMSRLTPEEQEDLRRLCRKLGKGGEESCQERLDKETRNVANPTE
jgi:MarR family transcriptional regulator, 2-MHQ and catechol-resistance regulon repressor